MTIKMTLAAAALALSAPAFAANNDLGTAVVYGGLDLASPKGAAQLERRIQRAADHTCGYRSANNLNERAHVMACQKEFIAEAKAKLEPIQTAARNSRFGQSLAAR